MMVNCKECGQSFEVTENDLLFYEKISPTFGEQKFLIPPPVKCPDCRQKQRMSFRNERHLYKSRSSLSEKEIISIYPPEKSYKVYDQNEWWSDAFNPLQYGKNYDFEKTFFQQIKELLLEVPKLAIQNTKSENCTYTNYAIENKNCYLVVGSYRCEDCYYSHRIFYSKNVVDSFDMQRSELCYECIESKNLYNCTYCDHCFDSSNLTLSSYCKGCQDCFGCINLKNKQYCIFNKQYSKEEYEIKTQELRKNFEDTRKQYNEFKKENFYKNLNIVDCENCSGNNLLNCKNCSSSFVLKESEECHYSAFGEKNKICMDSNFFDNCELQYNSMSLEQNYNVVGANLAWFVSDSYYVTQCFNSKNLFGCVGMKNNQYCILNKQYSKEEYEALVPKIIEQMMKNGEWGEYYPVELSPFEYSETVAHDYFPLNKTGRNDIQKIPENGYCETCGKNYKTIPQERDFYTKMNLEVPKKCPSCRHEARILQRTPNKLWTRKCAKCEVQMQTSYSPERPERVYCEKCYLEAIY